MRGHAVRRSDFHYELPEQLIAQHPTERRDASRLLEVGADLRDRQFPELVSLLPAGAVVVLNDTRVIPARLRLRKDTGGAVELLFLEQVGSDADGGERWRCLARASKPLRPGARLAIDGAADAPEVVIAEGRGPDTTVVVALSGPALPLLERHGELPLPPYIARPDGNTDADAERYQTVFAARPGAIAAPTAGLHLTRALLEAIAARCEIARVTLHVGVGTFAPVRVDDLAEHRMHVERYDISPEAAAVIGSGRPVVAIGTTVVRALESAATGDGRVAAGPGETRLFIRPGYRFRVVDHLLTNFHLPESTLLMLVCAFAGYQRVMDAYRHAVAAGYRFFSYGDAMWLSRDH